MWLFTQISTLALQRIALTEVMTCFYTIVIFKIYFNHFFFCFGCVAIPSVLIISVHRVVSQNQSGAVHRPTQSAPVKVNLLCNPS